MAFMLGAFTNGLASGAKNAMDLYSEYEGIKSKKDLSDSLAKAQGSGSGGSSGSSGSSGSKAPAGTAPGQAAAGAISTDGNFLGNAQSDSAASAPNPAPDLNADPRKPALTNSQRAALTTAGGGISRAFGNGNAKSDAAASAPTPQSQSNQGPLFSPATGGATGGASAASTPTPALRVSNTPGPPSGPGDMSQLTNRPVGAAVSDWIHGTNTPNQPMQYLPQNPQPGQQMPQPGQPANVGVRPPMLSGAPAPGSPSLANNMTTMGQAIQTQYGGM